MTPQEANAKIPLLKSYVMSNCEDGLYRYQFSVVGPFEDEEDREHVLAMIELFSRIVMRIPVVKKPVLCERLIELEDKNE